MVVTELDAEFTAPLRRLARHTVQSAVVVGAFVTALALLLAGGIVRPLRALIDSARSVERGGFEPARVDERRGDEIGLLGRAFNLMVDGLRARSRELEVFGRLVSPEVRERLLDGGLGLEGEMRHVAVLFSDIRGFSTMSETMPPQAVVAMLNEYMAAMTRAVREWRGYVNNFIGDAIVVVFGAPTGHDDVERRAARAALAMRDALAELNAVRVARGEAPLATGTGIGAGEVVAGQIGSPERAVYTVIGDVVNVASRLESLTKEKPGHPILVTRAVADAIAGDADLVAKPLGSEKVKGRSVPVELFALHRVKEEGGVRA
jgi:class 3 adenylate cyclase